jgi:hypothetical protein
LERAVTDDRDGPPSGYGAPGNLPPRASFFAARSLSLVLADFGTLLFFFLLFILILSFLFCCLVQSLQASGLSGFMPTFRKRARTKKLPLFSVNQQAPYTKIRSQKFYNKLGNRVERLSSDWRYSGSFLEPSCFSFKHTSVIARNYLRQLIDGSVLIVDGKLRVTDNVDKQNMRDLELDLFLDLGRRVPNATGNQRK